MLLGDPDLGLLPYLRSFFGWYSGRGEGGRCKHHRRSSLAGSLDRALALEERRWTRRARQGGWGLSWLRICIRSPNQLV